MRREETAEGIRERRGGEKDMIERGEREERRDRRGEKRGGRE